MRTRSRSYDEIDQNDTSCEVQEDQTEDSAVEAAEARGPDGRVSDFLSAQRDSFTKSATNGEPLSFENDESSANGGGTAIAGGPLHSTSFDSDNDSRSIASHVSIVQTRTPCTTCSVRLRHEITSPLFGISEPEGKHIDIARTFAPRPLYLSWLLRLSFLVISLESLFQTLKGTPQWKRWFFMAYLTHWGLVVAIVYQVAAVACLMFRNRVLYQPHRGEKCSRLVRLTWGLFSLAAPVELIICILYWGLDYVPGKSVNLLLVMNHGGIALLLLVDGFILSSYPLQLKQGIFTIMFCVAYLIWTVVFAETDIPNPNVPENDDYIYHVLEWNANIRGAEIVSSLCAFVLPPTVFAMFWIISLFRRHLYVEDVLDEQEIELVHVGVNGVLSIAAADEKIDDMQRMASFSIGDDESIVMI